jgi:hypothetical protein
MGLSSIARCATGRAACSADSGAERVVTFRLPWADDRGDLPVDRGFRVEWSTAPAALP